MTERTPTDYALEFAEYMAKGAEQLIEAVNALAMAEQARDEGDGDELDAKVDEARQDCTEFLTGLRNDIHQFRTRRDRAARAAQSSTVGERKEWALKLCHALEEQPASSYQTAAVLAAFKVYRAFESIEKHGEIRQWVFDVAEPSKPAAQAEPFITSDMLRAALDELRRQHQVVPSMHAMSAALHYALAAAPAQSNPPAQAEPVALPESVQIARLRSELRNTSYVIKGQREEIRRLTARIKAAHTDPSNPPAQGKEQP